VKAQREGLPQSLLHATYFTDPLCSWSWAFEPQWRRLQMEFAPVLHAETRMGGLLATWDNYTDSVNDVSRPVQMGPLWFQMRALSGMPCVERIWYEDPPASSYPACLAVKAAGLQGEAAADAMLRRLREAVMLERRNIARREVLLDEARSLLHAEEAAGFVYEAFADAIDGAAALEALRDDIDVTRAFEVKRFPSLLLEDLRSGRRVTLTGYRPWSAVREVLQRLAPEVLPAPIEANAATYLARWRRATAREFAEVLSPQGVTAEQMQPATAAARAALEAIVQQGQAERHGEIYVWRNIEKT
jgi:predicted DsbA family dithiol-disulfide isomerase